MGDECFFSEPGKTTFEIKDGLVFATYKSGKRTIERCTTIASFKRENRKAQKLIEKFDLEQSGVVRSMR